MNASNPHAEASSKETHKSRHTLAHSAQKTRGAQSHVVPSPALTSSRIHSCSNPPSKSCRSEHRTLFWWTVETRLPHDVPTNHKPDQSLASNFQTATLKSEPWRTRRGCASAHPRAHNNSLHQSRPSLIDCATLRLVTSLAHSLHRGSQVSSKRWVGGFASGGHKISKRPMMYSRNSDIVLSHQSEHWLNSQPY